MTHKKHYKKFFVIAVALVILFAPVGFAAAQSAPPGGSSAGGAQLGGGQGAGSTGSTGTTGSTGSTPVAPGGTGPTTAGAGAGTTVQQNPSFLSCAINLATCGVYYTAYVVNGIGGLGLIVGAWLVKLGLQFNDNVFNSPAVQTGFSVSLAIANLGFVLGIIIIAIATIIRNQTYGIKQLLWKLVLMAILVNFGLVITAPIVGFANDMSVYFINATSPSAATGGYAAYVTTMMTPFQPQQAILNGSSGITASSLCGSIIAQVVGGPPLKLICDITNNPSAQTTNQDALWQSTMALIFDAVFSFIAALTFICLAVLLIVRYLMLGGLLIVLPLAWLTYVFPKFDSSYSKWWNEFIKWTFFPPLALFFIYLAFITAANSSITSTQGTATNAYIAAALGGNTSNSPDTLEQSIANQTAISGQLVEQAADEILLVGLMIMGLMFANSLAGKAGSTVVNGATAATRAVGGRARKHATRAYQKVGGEQLNKSLQSSRIPLVGAIGRGFANVTERGSKDLVAERGKHLDLAGMDDDRLVSVTKGLKREEDQMAAVQEWQKRGKLDKIEKIGGGTFEQWLTKNQKGLGYMAQGKLNGDINKQLMSDELMREIAREMAPAAATADTKAAADGAQVRDKNGIMGTPGAVVSAQELAKAAKDMDTKDARAIISDPKSSESDVKNAEAHIKEIEDAAASADAAIASAVEDAIDKKRRDVDVKDVNDLLGRGAGQTVKAGELMDAASEKFWAGKDKGDVSKMRPDWMFAKNPKFGLDKESLKALQKATAHGVATQTPTHLGSIAGKIDNSKSLNDFMRSYGNTISEEFTAGRMSVADRKKILDGMKRILERKFAQIGGGGGGGGGGEPH